MATKLYPRLTAADWTSGDNTARLNGVNAGWTNTLLSITAGSSASTVSITTVAGPTNGLEANVGGSGRAFVSPPLDADVTISGSITWNIWAAESAATVNAAVNGRLEVIDGATGTTTLIDQTARTTEVALTTRAVNNFAETPGAGVACKRGDRLRVRIFFDDSVDGNMAAGTATYSYDTSGAVDGDTWLELTENLTFASEPAGTTIYPTDTASAVSTASVDREAWTSRGAGVQTDVRNTAAGFTAPLQMTDTAGGTVVDWFTKPLTAFTLGGAVRCNIRGLESNNAANATTVVEIARVAGDGTSPTVWAKGASPTELTTSETARSFLVAGDDLAVSDGQRLRIRIYADDYGVASMGASQTVTLYYAGTSGGASGDTYLTFTQTLTEYSPTTVTPTTAALTSATFAPTVTATDHQLVTPTTAALTSATFAPTVTTAAHQLATPTTATVVLATFAPTVSASDHQSVTPTTNVVVLSAFAPMVTASDHQAVTPVTKVVTLTTFAPTVSNPDPQLVTPTTQNLVLATFAPSVGVSDAASIVPPNAALSLTTYAPTVTVPDPQLVTPSTSALELHGFEPVITATNHQAVIPTTAAVVAIRYAPSVAVTANQSAIPTTKALTLATYAPAVTVNNIVATVAIGLTLTTFTPVVTAGTNTYAFPDPASLTLTGYAPAIDLSAFKLVTPAAAVLVLTTYPPTAEQHSITPLPDMVYGFAIVAMGDSGRVGSAQGGATVRSVEEGSTTVSTSGPSARVTIR